jgi:hypothetical protein
MVIYMSDIQINNATKISELLQQASTMLNIPLNNSNKFFGGISFFLLFIYFHVKSSRSASPPKGDFWGRVTILCILTFCNDPIWYKIFWEGI